MYLAPFSMFVGREHKEWLRTRTFHLIYLYRDDPTIVEFFRTTFGNEPEMSPNGIQTFRFYQSFSCYYSHAIRSSWRELLKIIMPAKLKPSSTRLSFEDEIVDVSISNRPKRPLLSLSSETSKKQKSLRISFDEEDSRVPTSSSDETMANSIQFQVRVSMRYSNVEI